MIQNLLKFIIFLGGVKMSFEHSKFSENEYSPDPSIVYWHNRLEARFVH